MFLAKQDASNISNRANVGDASVPATQFIPMVVPSQKVIIKPTQPPQPVTKAEAPPLQKSTTDKQHEETSLSQPAIISSKNSNETPFKSLQDSSISPTETELGPPTVSVPEPFQTLPPDIQSETVSSVIPSNPNKQDRPKSLPPNAEEVSEEPKETSLGDYGGYYSREDLRTSLNMEEGEHL